MLGLSSDGLVSDGLSRPLGLLSVSDGVHATVAAAARISIAIKRFMMIVSSLGVVEAHRERTGDHTSDSTWGRRRP
jgi:hypothetical protein